LEKAEFDKFADEYLELHAANVEVFGEGPAYFAEYKVKDVAMDLENVRDVGSILDFGGGIGTSAPYLRHHFPEAAITCLDVSDNSLEIARERYGDMAEFVSFDGASIPFDSDTFDVAFAACVFHHIKPASHAALFRELERVIGPGGHLFVFEHNPFNPLTRHAVDTCPFDENAVLISGRRMCGALLEAGFHDVRLRYRLFIPRLLSGLRFLESYLTWLPLGAQYYVSGRKAGWM